jgi:cytoskeleton protein RodZ
MPERNSNLTFGLCLKSKREEAGLDPEYIFRETRISPQLLESLENEDHAKLPESVYVKGFIRAYVKVLGVDADNILHKYEESRRNYLGITQSKIKLAGKRNGFWLRFLIKAMFLALLIGIVALAISFYSYRFRSETMELTAPAEKIQHPKNKRVWTIKISEQPDKTNQQASGSLTEENLNGKEASLSEIKPALLNLSISATTTTWLKVIIDGNGENLLEYSLQPGDKIALNAKSRYNLLIGNAGGLQLNLNGQPIQVPGKMGQIVTLTLP